MSAGNRRHFLRSSLAAGALAMAASPAQPSFAPLKLKRGINAWPWFSLTREFPAPRTGYGAPPFQTQRPVPAAADLARLKKLGFDFIRLPVDPGPFLAAAAPERDRLLDTLLSAVALAHEAGLNVIVNLQANGATHYWNPERLYAALSAPEFPAYAGLVHETAKALQRFPAPMIALEPVNEPPQACAADDWAAVQGRLLALARAANPALTLIACGGCGSMIGGLQALDPAPLRKLSPLLYTFHYYEPYLFSHQGAPWMREPVYAALNNVAWPASAGSLQASMASVSARMTRDLRPADEKARALSETERLLREYYAANPDVRFVRQHFELVASWAKTHAISMDQILLGEFGALRSDERYVAAPAADRIRYIRDVRETAEAFGLPWAFWNLFDGFGAMDETTRKFDPDIASALDLPGAE